MTGSLKGGSDKSWETNGWLLVLQVRLRSLTPSYRMATGLQRKYSSRRMIASPSCFRKTTLATKLDWLRRGENRRALWELILTVQVGRKIKVGIELRLQV